MAPNTDGSSQLARDPDVLAPHNNASGFEAADRTFAQLLCDRARLEPHGVAFCTWRDGAARPTSWREYFHTVQYAALGLHSLGIQRGDRVAIMSSTRHEWVEAALAILSVNGVLVGVYPTSSSNELEQALSSSGATAIVAESDADIAKVAAVAARLPHLRATIGFDAEPTGVHPSVAAVDWQSLLRDGAVLAKSDPTLFSSLVEAGDIDQPAALFFTSGSTGAPKGVVHTHRTLQYSVLSGVMMTYPDISRQRYDLVGFLGLSHVAPALIGVFAPVMTKLIITYCSMEQRAEALVGVRPTAVVWPPRMHEKLASETLQIVTDAGRLFRLKYSAAMKIARQVSALRWAGRSVPRHLDALYALCMKTVFIPLRAKIGMDRITVSWTASGSMAPDVLALWHMWGLDLRELYGTTETCGAVLAQWDRPFPAPGTIGKVMPDSRWVARVSDDGELQIQAPCLFTGYWNNEAATSETMPDGWYRTGDLVERDSDGEFTIIGRLKDVIKTSGGKSVSPQPIEVRLKTSPLIDEAIVVGEGRKYLTALLAVSHVAQAMTTADRNAALRQWIDEINMELARPLQIKDFRVLPRALSAEAGELTLKATIRRANILASFADLVDAMYDAEEQNAIVRQTRIVRTKRA